MIRFLDLLRMWLALQKYGIPDVTIDLVRGLHKHMGATVSVADESAWIRCPMV